QRHRRSPPCSPAPTPCGRPALSGGRRRAWRGPRGRPRPGLRPALPRRSLARASRRDRSGARETVNHGRAGRCAEQHFPARVVATHGAVGLITFTIVLITATPPAAAAPG